MYRLNSAHKNNLKKYSKETKKYFPSILRRPPQGFQIPLTPRMFMSGTLWKRYLPEKLCLIWAGCFQPSVVSIYINK